MMIKNHDQWVEISNSPKWPYVSDHPYGILIIGSLVSGKTNVQLNLIKNHWSDIDKIYLYVKIHLNQIINFILMEDKN